MTLLVQPEAHLSTLWQQQGQCRAEDAAVFFPPTHFEHKPERDARETAAKAICARCAVRRDCLDWALATGEPHGIWGGRSEIERKQLLLGRRRSR